MAIKIKQMWTNAQRVIEKAQKKTAKFMNIYYKEVTYRVGDWVFLSIKNIDIIRPLKKIDYKIIGPFKIVREIRGSYKLDLLKLMS